MCVCLRAVSGGTARREASARFTGCGKREIEGPPTLDSVNKQALETGAVLIISMSSSGAAWALTLPACHASLTGGWVFLSGTHVAAAFSIPAPPARH